MGPPIQRNLSFAADVVESPSAKQHSDGTDSASLHRPRPQPQLRPGPGPSSTMRRGLSIYQDIKTELPEHLRSIEEYDELDFLLPDEELPDGRMSYHEQQVLKRQQFRIKNAARELKTVTKTADSIDKLFVESVMSLEAEKSARLYRNGASTNVLGRSGSGRESKKRAEAEGRAELALLKSVVGRDQRKAAELAKMTPEDFGDESTLDYPKLNSLEEAKEDLRLEGLERFYYNHGQHEAAIKWSCKDRRQLRRWFNALDFDGSGEVSVSELQDPLISAGVLMTRDQVLRVLLNADKNGTLGLDFKEFLDALHGTSLANTDKLVELQHMMGNSQGLAMDTLVTGARRKKLLNSILLQSEKRAILHQKEFKHFVNNLGNEKAADALKAVEAQADYDMLLHNKYVGSLAVVVEAKKTEQLNRDNAALDLSRAKRERQRAQASEESLRATLDEAAAGGASSAAPLTNPLRAYQVANKPSWNSRRQRPGEGSGPSLYSTGAPLREQPSTRKPLIALSTTNSRTGFFGGF